MAGEDIIAMSVRELRWLQVVHKVLDKEIRQKAAASLMGISERQVRRLVKGVRELGDRGMVHRSRGRPSNRRHPEGVKESVLRLYREQYRDFGPTLAVEKLLEREGISLSRETFAAVVAGSGFVGAAATWAAAPAVAGAEGAWGGGDPGPFAPGQGPH